MNREGPDIRSISEVTDTKFSSSEERAFKTCRLAHHFRYDLGYKRVIPNRKLSVGSLVHRGLEARYKGQDFMAITEASADQYWQRILAGNADMPGYTEALTNFEKDKELVLAMVKGYDTWAEETGVDDPYETIDVEQSYFVRIPGLPAGIPVRMDLVQRDKRDGSLRVVDFKTARYVPKDFTKFQLAEQNGNYQLAALAIYNERPTELGYRFLRKIIPSGRSKGPYFHEEPILLTKAELNYRVDTLRKIQAERFDPDKEVYAQPDNCCGSWKNDWRNPCMLVHSGYDPEDALEASPGYEKQEDVYDRYDDLEETDNGN